MVRIFKPPDTSHLLSTQQPNTHAINEFTSNENNQRLPSLSNNNSNFRHSSNNRNEYREPELQVEHNFQSVAPGPKPQRLLRPEQQRYEPRSDDRETNFYPLPVSVPVETKVVLDDKNIQSLIYAVKDTSKEQKRLLQTVLQLQSDVHEHERVQNDLLREESSTKRSIQEHYQQLALIVDGMREQLGQIGSQQQSDREASYRHLDMVGSDISESKQVSLMVKSMLEKSEMEMQRQVLRVEGRFEKDVAALSRELQDLRVEMLSNRDKMERQRLETSDIAQNLRRDIGGLEQQVTQIGCSITNVRDQLSVSEARVSEKLTIVDSQLRAQLQTQQHNLAEAGKLLTEAIQAVQTEMKQSIRSLEQTTAQDLSALHGKLTEVVTGVTKLDIASEALSSNLSAVSSKVTDAQVEINNNGRDVTQLYKELQQTRTELVQDNLNLRKKLKDTSKDLANGLLAVKNSIDIIQDEARTRQQVLERQVLATQIKSVQENEALKDELKKDIKQSQRPFIVI